jgi:hypothetical protein
MVIGGSSESGATTESHPGSQPQIAVNPDAAPWDRKSGCFPKLLHVI